MKIGILLVNLGTPDSYSVPDVRKYLRQFLMDGRVIDIPYIPRFLLVNGIIAPFRAPKSAKVYKSVWMKEGSPLKVYGEKLERLVQAKMGTNFIVKLAMRYQSPSIEKGLNELRAQFVEQIIVVPLFPQYASATNGSVIEEISIVNNLGQTFMVGDVSTTQINLQELANGIYFIKYKINHKTYVQKIIKE
jgi:ferrochelatase